MASGLMEIARHPSKNLSSGGKLERFVDLETLSVGPRDRWPLVNLDP
jgi:hypothetical protein